MSGFEDINLNDIEENPTIPAGEYHLKIVELEEGMSSKQQPKVNYRTVVQAGPYAGSTVFGGWSLQTKMLWRLKKDFKAMGYDPEDGKVHREELIGHEAIAKVEEQFRWNKEKQAPDPEMGKTNQVKMWIGKIT